MEHLVKLAQCLIRWSETHPRDLPIVIPAARDILILAETELRGGTMMRTAARGGKNPPPVRDVFQALSDSKRNLREILKGIESLQSSGNEKRVPPEVAKTVSSLAIGRLVRLANQADSAGSVPLADQIDVLLDLI
jgi:hypothetical protein